jgi:hypothetical protein
MVTWATWTIYATTSNAYMVCFAPLKSLMRARSRPFIAAHEVYDEIWQLYDRQRGPSQPASREMNQHDAPRH